MFVAWPVTGTSTMLVGDAGIGVAAAQAETTKARIVRLERISLFFIRSSDHVFWRKGARLNSNMLGI